MFIVVRYSKISFNVEYIAYLGVIICSLCRYGAGMSGNISAIGENSFPFGYYLTNFTSKVLYMGRYGRILGDTILYINYNGTNISFQPWINGGQPLYNSSYGT